MKGEHRRNDGGIQEEYKGNIGGHTVGMKGQHRGDEGGTREE